MSAHCHTTSFVNICNFVEVKIYYIVRLIVAVGILKQIVLCFSMRGKDVFEHTNVECHLCALKSTCRPLSNIDIHLITIVNILMPRY